MEDKPIIESFLRDRTEESFFPLFAAFYARVRRFFLLHGLSIQAAEDLSQEVFLKVYRKANELRNGDRFCGWMYAIARNVLISHWRKQVIYKVWAVANIVNPVSLRLLDVPVEKVPYADLAL